jgi:hypothetical protein
VIEQRNALRQDGGNSRPENADDVVSRVNELPPRGQ